MRLLSIIVPSLMRSNAIAHLEHLLLKQYAVDRHIELIFVGPSGNEIQLDLFRAAIERVRNLTALQIRLLFGGATVYQAMNIGISKARGQYLFFCGDTDTPLRDHLLSCIDTYKSYCGRTEFRPVLLGLVRKSCQLTKARLPKASGLGLATERNPTHHQAIIYPVEVFHSLGLYSSAFRVLGDYEFNLRLRSRVNMEKSGLSFAETNVVFCDFEDGGISASGRFGNYIESFKCKKPYLKSYLLPIALIVEVLSCLHTRVKRSF
jgi:hypothetical protein